jgi:hypothetical protein
MRKESQVRFGLQDARSSRGIMSRGPARYGVSRSPKPGKLFNIQKAAQRRMRMMNNQRRPR